ncbi:hypothetical protein J6590_015617 [Homalodisca vitripennis]|nr:hypothetical protein J6590_015617 [Homalodisca vitripennis]
MAYKGWIESKEEQMKQKIKDARRAHTEAQRRMATRRNERFGQSQQAFLAWLDLVDERFYRDLAKKRLQQQLTGD